MVVTKYEEMYEVVRYAYWTVKGLDGIIVKMREKVDRPMRCKEIALEIGREWDWSHIAKILKKLCEIGEMRRFEKIEGTYTITDEMCIDRHGRPEYIDVYDKDGNIVGRMKNPTFSGYGGCSFVEKVRTFPKKVAYFEWVNRE